QSGRLQASVQDELTARYYLEHDFPTLKIVGAAVDPTYFVAYTHRSNPVLRDRINDALLEMMSDGTLEGIYTKYGIWNDEMKKIKEVALVWPPQEEQSLPHDSLWPDVSKLARAASVTVFLASLAMPLAMLLGLIVAVGRLYGPVWVRLPLA